MNIPLLPSMPNASLRTCLATLLTAIATLDIAHAQIAIKGDTIHTVTGSVIRDGVVVIRDGKIAAVGPAGSTPIPADFRVLQAKVVTPGFIDAHSTVGISGMLN